MVKYAASNLFAYLVGSSFPYLWNLGTWIIFYSLGSYISASYIFPMAYTKTTNTWAIILFYALSEGLLPLFPSFIFRGRGGVD